MDKQKYWQYAAEPIIDTGKRNVITNGFIIDYNLSGIVKDVIEQLPLRNPDAVYNLKKRFMRCNRTEQSYEEGRGGTFGDLVIYRFPSGLMVQKKYAEYFKRLYPGCVFKTNPKGQSQIVSAWQNGDLMGGIACVEKNVPFRKVR